jgi:hypothetical protein
MFSEDAWLSGFIDGEGCFTQATTVRRKDGTRKVSPRFKIGLSIYDRTILDALQREFGGSITDHNRRNNGATTAYVWTVSGEALGRVIAYLDRFPLRAKKARQFAEWRKRHSL